MSDQRTWPDLVEKVRRELDDTRESSRSARNDNAYLRAILAHVVTGRALHECLGPFFDQNSFSLGPDPRLSDTLQYPHIDFGGDSPEVIAAKLAERSLSRIGVAVDADGPEPSPEGEAPDAS